MALSLLRRRIVGLRALAPVLVLLAGLAAGCGGTDDSTQKTVVTASSPPVGPTVSGPDGQGRAAGDRRDRRGERPIGAQRHAVERTVRDYVTGLAADDGAAVCALFVSGALDGFDFPARRGGCAGSLSASIGHHDPHGLPWRSARLEGIRAVRLGSGEARVTATVRTLFADRGQPSIEDDVIYLRRGPGGWLMVKPSSTIYRAVGVGDVPPQVLSPP